METLIGWLIEQAPVIVIMGVIIYAQRVELINLRKERNDLAKDAISIALKYEHKADLALKSDENTQKILEEIRRNTNGFNR